MRTYKTSVAVARDNAQALVNMLNVALHEANEALRAKKRKQSALLTPVMHDKAGK